VRELKKGEARKKERKFRVSSDHRFFRVVESFRAGTRAGLTRARSLNKWFIQIQNAGKKLTFLMPSSQMPLCAKKIRKFVERKRILKGFYPEKHPDFSLASFKVPRCPQTPLP